MRLDRSHRLGQASPAIPLLVQFVALIVIIGESVPLFEGGTDHA